jgi:DHA1 family tetracycline resistance protein-like MFS transporter
MSLTAIFSPLIFATGLFSYFTSPAAPIELPGAPFLLGSAMWATAFVILLRLFRKFPANNPSIASAPVESKDQEGTAAAV